MNILSEGFIGRNLVVRGNMESVKNRKICFFLEMRHPGRACYNMFHHGIFHFNESFAIEILRCIHYSFVAK